MALAEVSIDERLAREASEARRQEWLTLCRELVAAWSELPREDAHTLRITLLDRAFGLALLDEAGRELVFVSVTFEALAEHLDEYVDIVRQIAREDASAGVLRLEALDMAKKVVHDRAGRMLKKACREMGVDLEGARRLFSLLVSLRIDTTRLVGIHGHRL
ncbi:MAG: hypothetical protein GXY23_12700 [Myxococcales bacterium]|nr:hypothetical protein [Myxococcales bacterium]